MHVLPLKLPPPDWVRRCRDVSELATQKCPWQEPSLMGKAVGGLAMTSDECKSWRLCPLATCVSDLLRGNGCGVSGTHITISGQPCMVLGSTACCPGPKTLIGGEGRLLRWERPHFGRDFDAQPGGTNRSRRPIVLWHEYGTAYPRTQLVRTNPCLTDAAAIRLAPVSKSGAMAPCLRGHMMEAWGGLGLDEDPSRNNLVVVTSGERYSDERGRKYPPWGHSVE